jgi:tRNA uridine 5-carboxymethylaminomethyl modification enzyme
LVAGINAACRLGGKAPIVVGRTQGYTGILIDDLVNKGADEPYRMFTSRAEFRLHLRIDNADERLTPIGRRVGLVTEDRWSLYRRKQDQRNRLTPLLENTRVDPITFPTLGTASDDRPTLLSWLRRPEAKISSIAGWIREKLAEEPVHGLLTTVETEAKYAGYIAQQERQIDRLKDSERRRIPDGFEFEDIPGLSNEVKQKLRRVRPETLGQAGRIPGVTPAAIAVLDVYLSVGARV